MAKTLRTSGNYTIKTGTGASGSNSVFLDTKTTRIQGDLVVDGTRTELNSTTLTIEDQFLIVNKNNSTADTEDSGIFFNRGSENHGLLFWDADAAKFKFITTTNASTVTTISNITLAKLEVAEPASSSDVATKNYVDSTSAGAALSGSTNNQVTTVTGASAIQGEANLTFDGTTLVVTGVVDADYVRINDNQITTNASNADLEITANGSGNVKINGIDFLTSGAMISKSKATALAIALG